jgi:hypothetical protein
MKTKIKNICFGTLISAMLLMVAPISVYVKTGNITPIIINTILTLGCVAIPAGIATLVLMSITRDKSYKAPMERLNTAYITLCIVAVLLIEAVLGEYIVLGHENYWIINPVTLLGIFAVACIPLGAIFQLVVRIDHQLRIKKRLAQRG